MKIYKLSSKANKQVYVGKTKTSLEQRLYSHKAQYKLWLEGKETFLSSFFLTEHPDCKIDLIEETDNSMRENYWINKLDCVNFRDASENIFISKKKDRTCLKGFIWEFKISRKGKIIVGKQSTNLNYLKGWRDCWINSNPSIFHD